MAKWFFQSVGTAVPIGPIAVDAQSTLFTVQMILDHVIGNTLDGDWRLEGGHLRMRISINAAPVGGTVAEIVTLTHPSAAAVPALTTNVNKANAEDFIWRVDMISPDNSLVNVVDIDFGSTRLMSGNDRLSVVFINRSQAAVTLDKVFLYVEFYGVRT